ncbi:MAG: glycosyltransferase, partial [Bacteroidales bacterium]|nr:glycosyltransferase [Bacteroidales bacterium]
KNHKAWSKVNYYGFVNRVEASEILAKSKAGLVTFFSAPNHIHARPNKMFEYMSAGLPIIASDFTDWKEIIEKHQVGICVNPESPIAIAEAVKKIFENEDLTTQFSKNGKKAINESFNWESEAKKLTELYKQINKF